MWRLNRKADTAFWIVEGETTPAEQLFLRVVKLLPHFTPFSSVYFTLHLSENGQLNMLMFTGREMQSCLNHRSFIIFLLFLVSSVTFPNVKRKVTLKTITQFYFPLILHLFHFDSEM